GDGDDIIDASQGVNKVRGGDGSGDGNDTVSYAHAAIGIDIGLANSFLSNGEGGAAHGDTFFSIENAIRSEFADIIDLCTRGRESGGGGDDQLKVGPPGGTLSGQAGDDDLLTLANAGKLSILRGGIGSNELTDQGAAGAVTHFWLDLEDS